jgi:hypothetical protein
MTILIDEEKAVEETNTLSWLKKKTLVILGT